MHPLMDGKTLRKVETLEIAAPAPRSAARLHAPIAGMYRAIQVVRVDVYRHSCFSRS